MIKWKKTLFNTVAAVGWCSEKRKKKHLMKFKGKSFSHFFVPKMTFTKKYKENLKIVLSYARVNVRIMILFHLTFSKRCDSPIAIIT